MTSCLGSMRRSVSALLIPFWKLITAAPLRTWRAISFAASQVPVLLTQSATMSALRSADWLVSNWIRSGSNLTAQPSIVSVSVVGDPPVVSRLERRRRAGAATRRRYRSDRAGAQTTMGDFRMRHGQPCRDRARRLIGTQRPGADRRFARRRHECRRAEQEPDEAPPARLHLRGEPLADADRNIRGTPCRDNAQKSSRLGFDDRLVGAIVDDERGEIGGR